MSTFRGFVYARVSGDWQLGMVWLLYRCITRGFAPIQWAAKNLIAFFQLERILRQVYY